MAKSRYYLRGSFRKFSYQRNIQKGKLEVKLNQSDIITAENYSEIPDNTLAAIKGSTNRLEISIKNGNAARSIVPNSIKARIV